MGISRAPDETPVRQMMPSGAPISITSNTSSPTPVHSSTMSGGGRSRTGPLW